MWEKLLLCFFRPPCEATEIHHIEQNNKDYKRKGLAKEERKSRDTQSSEEKRGDTNHFAAERWIGEGCTFGSN